MKYFKREGINLATHQTSKIEFYPEEHDQVLVSVSNGNEICRYMLSKDDQLNLKECINAEKYFKDNDLESIMAMIEEFKEDTYPNRPCKLEDHQILFLARHYCDTIEKLVHEIKELRAR